MSSTRTPGWPRAAVASIRPTGSVTWHAVARQLSFVASGNHVRDGGGSAFTADSASWYFLDRVDVLAPPRDLGTVVAFGDSITDGVGATLGANGRWPNDLARRLNRVRGRTLGVIDEGIGGNQVLHGSLAYGGEAGLERFHRDAVAQPGAKVVILLEGVNDIVAGTVGGPLTAPRTDVSARQIIAGYERLIREAHAARLRILGATLTPFEGAMYWTPAGEAKREAINHWILTSGAFDGVADFAAALADPHNALRLDPAYDSGDHLHPSDAGYRTMARALNLRMLTR